MMMKIIFNERTAFWAVVLYGELVLYSEIGL